MALSHFQRMGWELTKMGGRPPAETAPVFRRDRPDEIVRLTESRPRPRPLSSLLDYEKNSRSHAQSGLGGSRLGPGGPRLRRHAELWRRTARPPGANRARAARPSSNKSSKLRGWWAQFAWPRGPADRFQEEKWFCFWHGHFRHEL